MAYSISTTKTWAETVSDLTREFQRWKVTDWDLEGPTTQIRNGRSISATAVYLRFKTPAGDEVAWTYDRQRRAVDNLRALFLTVESLRLIDVRGVGDLVREAYLQLPAPTKQRDPWEVLGIRPDAPFEDIEAMYRIKAKRLHPDHEGDAEAMKELNLAFDRIKAERSS